MDHWYNHIGEPCYGAGLREARKMGYLPSITSVDKVIANTGLNIWMQNIILKTAMMNPQGDFDDDYYMEFIKNEAFRESRQAAKLGTVLHKFAERYIKGLPLFFTGNRPDVWDIFAPLKEWIDYNLLKPETGIMHNEGTEVVLVNKELGYAGKADFKGKLKTNKRNVISDFKTTFLSEKDIKKDGHLKKAKLYDSWPRQLIALDMCTPSKEVNILMSVVISTNPDFPGVWTHEWDDKSLGKAWIEFTGALNIYRSIKGL